MYDSIFAHFSIQCSITAITQRVTVGEGDPAHFECAVSANPFTPETIRWERNNYDMLARTVTTPGAPKDQVKTCTYICTCTID
jgi:hypothetical protein